MDGAEVAAEATDFFESMEQSNPALQTPNSISDMLCSTTSSQGQEMAIADDDLSWEAKSIDSLHSLIASKDSPLELKTVPKMSQRHFIDLLKTLYDIFSTQPNEQETYQQIASIGDSSFSNFFSFSLLSLFQSH